MVKCVKEGFWSNMGPGEEKKNDPVDEQQLFVSLIVGVRAEGVQARDLWQAAMACVG